MPPRKKQGANPGSPDFDAQAFLDSADIAKKVAEYGPRAVIFASLPRGPAELVLRASTAPRHAPESIDVLVDGRQTARLMMEGSDYRDLPVSIPADPGRPSISEITLQLKGAVDETPVFRLDRISIR